MTDTIWSSLTIDDRNGSNVASRLVNPKTSNCMSVIGIRSPLLMETEIMHVTLPPLATDDGKQLSTVTSTAETLPTSNSEPAMAATIAIEASRRWSRRRSTARRTFGLSHTLFNVRTESAII